MILTVRKLKELPDAFHPDNIKEGFEIKINTGDMWAKPEVEERFPAMTWWSTSKVQEIIDEKTFRTLNSIYEYEYNEELNELYKENDIKS